ncbi:hypothetical protein K1T71_001205 [Dendrolimus kikuchii]|uniref:Uncharacterized protein n=1 Tax=Dendrolimus kikuchii TaxID=765133 RepID=A0ACC1DGZ9_9NEOP|nr:hypothetical protein K1T71_001205 [Dendrolimus kikuchii]
MAFLKSLLLLLTVKSVICEDSLLQPCQRSDITCLSQATEQFLEKTHKGIKEYDIRPIDPLLIKSLTLVADKDMGLSFYFTNLTVRGLKNQTISDFQMDVTTKSVVLKTKADLYIVGNIVIELSKQSKSFNGVYTTQASVIGSASYNYDLKKDAQGVEHFDVGPETITCEVIAEPKATLSKELSQALLNDAIAMENMSKYEANKVQIHRETVCEIAKLAYIDVIHNIRASAKILPKSAFFIDI